MKRILENLTPSEKFIVLALAADEKLKKQSVVFHYFGPTRLKRIAKSLKTKKIAKIIEALHNLEQDANSLSNTFPVFRKSYLLSQIKSLRAFLEYAGLKPTGEALLNAVRKVIGVEPPKPYDLNELNKEFNVVLHEYGYRTYEEFKKDIIIHQYPMNDNEITKLIVKLKSYCEKDIIPHLLFGENLLPKMKKSKINISKPEEGYPSCYYIYEGNFNASIYLSPPHRESYIRALQSLLHETYPGHHLYYLYREMLFEKGLLEEEATIDLLYSAETTLNEGVAETAYKFMDSFRGKEKVLINVSNAREDFCKKILYNIWYEMNINKNMLRNEATDYLKKNGQIEENRHDEIFLLIDEWRVYYPSYPAGLDTIKSFINKGEKKYLRYLYVPKPVDMLNNYA